LNAPTNGFVDEKLAEVLRFKLARRICASHNFGARPLRNLFPPMGYSGRLWCHIGRQS
jgi:hypothetical protein